MKAQKISKIVYFLLMILICKILYSPQRDLRYTNVFITMIIIIVIAPLPWPPPHESTENIKKKKQISFLKEI